MAKPSCFRPRWPASLPPSYGPYAATLDRWIDGDTGLFVVDLGFGRYEHVEIRVLDLATADDPHPETVDALNAAYDFLRAGGRVRLHTTGMKATFTRWVARVELEHGLDFRTAMTEAGHHRPDLSR